jgi:hypothetical protein
MERSEELYASVTTDHDHHVNFSFYKTYSWGHLRTPDSMWDARVKDAIDSQLVAKGWREVPSGGDVIGAISWQHDWLTVILDTMCAVPVTRCA